MSEPLLIGLYLYFLRFDLLAVGVLSVLVWSSRKGGSLAPMFGGMFDLSPRRAAWVAMGTALLGVSLATTGNLILLHGPERFWTSNLPGWVRLSWMVLAGAPCAVLLLRLVLENRERNRLGAGLYVVAGLAAGLMAALGLGWFGINLARFVEWVPVFRWSPEGYLKDGVLLPDHGAALTALTASAAVYAFGGWYTGRRIKLWRAQSSADNRDLPVPALGWVVALLMLLSWFLTGISFFFDRFPLSTLAGSAAALAIYLFGPGRLWIEPHTYHGFARIHPPRPATPGELLKRAGGKAVVICATGGGIHAAAWAAHIFEELEKACPHVRNRLVLTSSVSGGSVACFYILASYGEKVQPGQLFRMASASSLDFVAWGFGFRDLVRYLLPVGKMFGWGNRSWALERAWRRFADWNAGAEPHNGPLWKKLEDWEQDTARGDRPGAVFNSTIVETGERLSIATILLQGKTRFRDLYPDLTIRVAAAVGLSAAFPVVSPAARIWTGKDPEPERRYHIVDGGYYDNFGILSALDFLEQGLSELPESDRPQMLIVRIEGHQDQPPAAEVRSGMWFQVMAPFKTLLTMRSSSQAARNRLELDLMKKRWGCLQEVCFQYPHAGAPLTWHLTEAQKKEILSTSGDPEFRRNVDQVKAFCGSVD